MKLELVESVTVDKLTLHGLLYTPDEPGVYSLPALLFIHGGGQNFYETPLRKVAEHLVSEGYSCLVTNTRGHDWVANSYRRPRFIGGAFELFEDSLLDYDAALASLKSRGYSRVVVVGHSLGAAKTAYCQSQRANPIVDKIVLCSPAYLSFARLSTIPGYKDMLATATDLVKQDGIEQLIFNKLPAPGYFTARTLLDKYSPDERANTLKYVDMIRCPVLLTWGTGDRGQKFAEAIREKTVDRGWQYETIEGADHFYTGCEATLAQRIAAWLLHS